MLTKEIYESASREPMPRLKIVWKFFLIQTILIIISILTIGFYVGFSLKGYYLEQIASQLSTNAALISDIISKDLIDGRIDSLDSLTKRLSREIHARITVIDPKGIVLGDSKNDPLNMENHSDRPEIIVALNGKTGKSIRFSETLKIDMMYLAMPIEREGLLIGAVRVSLPLSEVNKRVIHIYGVIFWGILLAIIISFSVGFIIAGKIGQPIIQMTHAAREIARGDFSKLIRTDLRDEIGDLAHSFNVMSLELQNKIETLTKEIDEKQAILSGMIEGVIAIDQDQRIILINSTAEVMFDISCDKALDRFHWEIIRISKLNALFQEVLETGNNKVEELTLHYREERMLQVQMAAIPDEEGVPWAVVAVFHDITEIRRLENVRKEFVANVSHELKTPLTSIKGSIETLQEGAINDSENSLRFINIIKKHSDRLERLIDDLLDLSQIESGKIEMDFEPVNLSEIVNGVASNFEEITSQKGQKINVNIPSGLPYVLADEEKIETVLTNLLDNAVKYTPEFGEITISAVAKDSEVQIEVADTGIGIPAKELPRVFERFYRVDNTRSRELGGTGLGLSIVKHIVEAHGGTVNAQSELGIGSRVAFTLPKVL
jgi:two-component system phosphate regulon sensor histidine kinase PhoR